MKVTFVYNEIPNKEHSTDLYNAWLLLGYFKKQGFQVELILFLLENSTVGDRRTRRRWLQELVRCGYHLVILPHQSETKSWRQNGVSFLRTDVGALYPEVALAVPIRRLLEKSKPDFLFLWGNWPALASVYGIDLAPKFAFVGDLPHLAQSYHLHAPFKKEHKKTGFRHLSERWRLHRLQLATLELLTDFDKVATTAHHYADWLNTKDIAAEWLPNFIPDWGGQDWRQRRGCAGVKTKTKIMLLGHVETTANFSGMDFFIHQILPELEKRIPDEFEVHICGKGKLPLSWESRLNRSWIKRRGFVPDIIAELRDTDIFLVPTPIEIGIRVRIPYAWSVGCAVVAHLANQKGLTELRHEENVLLANTGETIVDAIVRLRENPELQASLGRRGRETFEREFSEEVVGRKIMNAVTALSFNKRAQGLSELNLKEETPIPAISTR